MQGKTIKLFSNKMICELGEMKDFGYAGGKNVVWKAELMDKYHEKILKILHQKLDDKILVFHDDIIGLSTRATSYGCIKRIDWSREYKTCFRIEYARMFLDVDDTPCVRLGNNDSTYADPRSKYTVLTKAQFQKLLDAAVRKATAQFFK